MILTNDLIIPIPKIYNTQVKVEINGADETSKVAYSEWNKLVTFGIGTFKIKLKNAHGRVSDLYVKGQTVKFYYDNTTKTRLQFQGRIDKATDKISRDGQFVEIMGRHRSFILNETRVNYKATGMGHADILKAIIDEFSSGFTYTNVNNTGEITDVDWDYKPFWDCVKELCSSANFDCRVDNDLDFHFHRRDSIINYDEAIVEGQNHIDTGEFGTDDYFEKTRVTAIGEDDNGIPVIHTEISDTEGSVIREIPIKDASVKTIESAQRIAKAELTEANNRPPQGDILSKAMETLEPGEDIWVLLMRQKIVGVFRVIQHTLLFGSEVGGIRSKTIFEREIVGIGELIEKGIVTENRIQRTDNINKLNYSYNLTFESDDDTISHQNTKVENGRLSLELSSDTSGIFTSNKKTASQNISRLELRYVGGDLSSSRFHYSVDNGITWEEFTARRTIHEPEGTGKDLKIRVQLIKDSINTWPTIDSMAILYS